MRDNKLLKICFSLCFWIGLWWLAASAVHQSLILPSPAEVFRRFFSLLKTEEFWLDAGSSLLRILLGFAIGLCGGTLFAVLSESSAVADAIFSPMVRIFKAAPVASFIILLMLWIRYGFVPVIVAAIMVVPVVYQNVRTGIQQVNPEYLQLAKAYRFSGRKRLRLIYIPSVLPYFASGALTSFGLAWKSGVAAEVLCLPENAVGSKLYFSKLYLETPDLFAWTIVVILCSFLLEALLKKLLMPMERRGNVKDAAE